MKIVGLVGPKRSGKTTAAEVLVRERGFVSIGFADALKDLALRADPEIYLGPLDEYMALSQLVELRGWEEAKRCGDVRRFLQELGTGVRDIDPKFWINALERKLATMPRTSSVVIPDVRFINEAYYTRYFGAADDQVLLIRITRPGLVGGDTHISETEQLGIECDTEIENDSSMENFGADVLAAVDCAFEL